MSGSRPGGLDVSPEDEPSEGEEDEEAGEPTGRGVDGEPDADAEEVGAEAEAAPIPGDCPARTGEGEEGRDTKDGWEEEKAFESEEEEEDKDPAEEEEREEEVVMAAEDIVEDVLLSEEEETLVCMTDG